jgi:hypothetical protein
MSSLPVAKARTTRALAGLDLPEAFTAATVAAEAKLLAVSASERTEAQRRDLRRVSRKAHAIEVRVTVELVLRPIVDTTGETIAEGPASEPPPAAPRLRLVRSEAA